MIDLHCHLLPALDDGARDLDEALAMARLAVADGIRHAVLTPHLIPGVFENHKASNEHAVAAFRDALAAAGIPLAVSTGGEVRIGAEVLSLVAAERVPYIGQWDGEPVMLLELPHSHIPPGSDKLVAWLRAQGIRPLLAHPERNPDIVREPARLRGYIDLGCLVQVTSGSLTGDFGDDFEATAVTLLEQGWVDVLASDAHRADRRRPAMSPGRLRAAEIVGEEASWRLVRETPARIVGS